MKTLTDYLKKSIQHQPFEKNELADLFHALLKAPPIQQAALLASLSTRGLSQSELAILLKALKQYSTAIPSGSDCIDIVGTGGDGLKTFNISTASCLVVASCGVPVAKHGGRAVSSNAGSADVASQLKLPLHQDKDQIQSDLKTFHFAYLCAPFFNQALATLSELRKSLHIPSFLNLLGPLANPASVKRQVVGVYRQDMLENVAAILQQSGSIHAMVVCSDEGMDELSLSSKTQVMHLKNNTLHRYEISPVSLGLNPAPLHAIQGGTAQDNAKLIESIFQSKTRGPCLDIVLLNAAAGLMVSDRVPHLKAGIAMAREAIQSGKTLSLLNQLRRQHV